MLTLVLTSTLCCEVYLHPDAELLEYKSVHKLKTILQNCTSQIVNIVTKKFNKFYSHNYENCASVFAPIFII